MVCIFFKFEQQASVCSTGPENRTSKHYIEVWSNTVNNDCKYFEMLGHERKCLCVFWSLLFEVQMAVKLIWIKIMMWCRIENKPFCKRVISQLTDTLLCLWYKGKCVKQMSMHVHPRIHDATCTYCPYCTLLAFVVQEQLYLKTYFCHLFSKGTCVQRE